MNVSVIGFGHIGSVISSVLSSKGCKVTGIDLNLNLVNEFKNGNSPISEPNLQDIISSSLNSKNLTITDTYDSIRSSEVVIITVGTPLNPDNEADLSGLKKCCDDIEPYLRSGQLVILKSTVPPGVTRNIVEKSLNKNKDIDVVFSPERLAEGNAIIEFQTLPIVIGGKSNKASLKASKFWKKWLNVKTIIVNNYETAEMVKLASNAWIDLNIALANDLARLTDKLDFKIDILEAINAANSLKKGSGYINILSPSNGVGGYCLTKDPLFLYSLGKNNGLELNTIKAGRITNDVMPEHSSNRIITYAKSFGKKLNDFKIAILGASFKSDSGDIRNSPVIPFIQNIKGKGINKISVFDPLVTESDKSKLGFYLNSSLEQSIKDVDCIAFMTGHKQFKDLSLNYLNKLSKPGCLIFDGRRYFSKNEIQNILSLGMNYRGVGRCI